jgi:hypothetical protein
MDDPNNPISAFIPPHNENLYFNERIGTYCDRTDPFHDIDIDEAIKGLRFQFLTPAPARRAQRAPRLEAQQVDLRRKRTLSHREEERKALKRKERLEQPIRLQAQSFAAHRRIVLRTYFQRRECLYKYKGYGKIQRYPEQVQEKDDQVNDAPIAVIDYKPGEDLSQDQFLILWKSHEFLTWEDPSVFIEHQSIYDEFREKAKHEMQANNSLLPRYELYEIPPQNEKSQPATEIEKTEWPTYYYSEILRTMFLNKYDPEEEAARSLREKLLKGGSVRNTPVIPDT